VDRADWPPVGDDEDPIPFVIVRDAVDGCQNACAHCRVGLPVVPPCAAGEPAANPIRKPRLGLISCQPFPRTDADLTELRKLDDVEPLGLRHRLRGLAGAAEIARINRVERDVREALRESGRLGASSVGQGPVGMPLPTASPVPVGLAVPGEQQRRHAYILP